MSRSGVTLSLLLALQFGCSSKDDTPSTPNPEDTGTIEDAGDETIAETSDPDAPTDTPTTGGCAPGEKTGVAGKTDSLKTSTGVLFNVRTATSYDPTVKTALVVVYAPAGADRALTESFTKLTPDVTKRGWIVAYANHVTPSTAAAVKGVAEIPKIISDQWCVDPARIYLTGHSDGGSVTTLVTLQAAVDAAAIGPSAAGVNGAYLAGQKCTAPVSVMVMHGRDDTLFPGFGKEAADWWQKCFKCTAGPAEANGCIPYTGCEGGVEVRYCEKPITHPTWPNMNADLLDFFDRFKRTK